MLRPSDLGVDGAPGVAEKSGDAEPGPEPAPSRTTMVGPSVGLVALREELVRERTERSSTSLQSEEACRLGVPSGASAAQQTAACLRTSASTPSTQDSTCGADVLARLFALEARADGLQGVVAGLQDSVGNLQAVLNSHAIVQAQLTKEQMLASTSNSQGTAMSYGPDLEERAQEIYTFLADRCDALSAVLERHMNNVRVELDAERDLREERCQELRADVAELGVQFTEVLEQRDWHQAQGGVPGLPKSAGSGDFLVDVPIATSPVAGARLDPAATPGGGAAEKLSPRPLPSLAASVSLPSSPQTLHRPTRQQQQNASSVWLLTDGGIPEASEQSSSSSPVRPPPMASVSLPSSPAISHRTARQQGAIWGEGPAAAVPGAPQPPSPQAGHRPVAQITPVRLGSALVPPLTAGCPVQAGSKGVAKAKPAALRGTPAGAGKGLTLTRSVSTPWAQRGAAAAAAQGLAGAPPAAAAACWALR